MENGFGDSVYHGLRKMRRRDRASNRREAVVALARLSRRTDSVRATPAILPAEHTGGGKHGAQEAKDRIPRGRNLVAKPAGECDCPSGVRPIAVTEKMHSGPLGFRGNRAVKAHGLVGCVVLQKIQATLETIVLVSAGAITVPQAPLEHFWI